MIAIVTDSIVGTDVTIVVGIKKIHLSLEVTQMYKLILFITFDSFINFQAESSSHRHLKYTGCCSDRANHIYITIPATKPEHLALRPVELTIIL